MDTVQFTARFPKIDPRNLDEFKKVAAEMLEVTKREQGNLEYVWFLSPDETVCVVRETYADSDAVLAHMAGMTELLPRLADLGGGMESECYGSPSTALLEAAPMLEGAVFRFYQSR